MHEISTAVTHDTAKSGDSQVEVGQNDIQLDFHFIPSEASKDCSTDPPTTVFRVDIGRGSR
jgi:hypothetical protein